MKPLIVLISKLKNETKKEAKERINEKLTKLVSLESKYWENPFYMKRFWIGGKFSGLLSKLNGDEEEYNKYTKLFLEEDFKITRQRDFSWNGEEDDVSELTEYIYKEIESKMYWQNDLDYPLIQYICLDNLDYEIKREDIGKYWVAVITVE